MIFRMLVELLRNQLTEPDIHNSFMFGQMDGNISREREREMQDRAWVKDTGESEGEGLTAGADVALVAVEETVSDPDVRPRGRVA